jgi:hypothetical protein
MSSQSWPEVIETVLAAPGLVVAVEGCHMVWTASTEDVKALDSSETPAASRVADGAGSFGA